MPEPPGRLGAYNIGSGTPHTVGEMAAALCDAAARGPDPLVTGDYRLGDVRHIMADSSRARQELQLGGVGDVRGGDAPVRDRPAARASRSRKMSSEPPKSSATASRQLPR